MYFLLCMCVCLCPHVRRCWRRVTWWNRPTHSSGGNDDTSNWEEELCTMLRPQRWSMWQHTFMGVVSLRTCFLHIHFCVFLGAVHHLWRSGPDRRQRGRVQHQKRQQQLHSEALPSFRFSFVASLSHWCCKYGGTFVGVFNKYYLFITTSSRECLLRCWWWWQMFHQC